MVELKAADLKTVYLKTFDLKKDGSDAILSSLYRAINRHARKLKPDSKNKISR